MVRDPAVGVLGALAVGGSVMGGGMLFRRYMMVEDPELRELREEMGLECWGDYCTLVEGRRLRVKQENITGELIELPEDSEGRIRVHRTREGDGSRFSFSIVGGEIAPTWASGSPMDRLEEFETYGIEEVIEDQRKKYFFRRESRSLDEIKKSLGLGGCEFPTEDNTDRVCYLNLKNLGEINFGKGLETTMERGGTVKLTISWVSDKERENNSTNYPFRYKFVFSGDEKVIFPGVVKEAGESVHFRIRVTGVGGGPRELSLEKVWDVEWLVGKLRFTECSRKTGSCRFPRTINFYRDGEKSVKRAKVMDYLNKRIYFKENVSDYNGGIKFFLYYPVYMIGGTQKTEIRPINKIEVASYEIKEQDVGDGETTWYLSKKVV